MESNAPEEPAVPSQETSSAGEDGKAKKQGGSSAGSKSSLDKRESEGVGGAAVGTVKSSGMSGLDASRKEKKEGNVETVAERRKSSLKGQRNKSLTKDSKENKSQTKEKELMKRKSSAVRQSITDSKSSTPKVALGGGTKMKNDPKIPAKRKSNVTESKDKTNTKKDLPKKQTAKVKEAEAMPGSSLNKSKVETKKELKEKVIKTLKDMNRDQLKELIKGNDKFRAALKNMSERKLPVKKPTKKKNTKPANKVPLTTKSITKETEVPSNNYKIGFISQGGSGKDFVNNLIKFNFDLKVWDLEDENVAELSGVSRANSLIDLVKSCDIIMWCLASSEASQTLLYSKLALEKLLRGKYLIDLTPSDCFSPIHMYNTARVEKARYLEVRVSSLLADINTGSAVIFTSGDEKAFNAVAPFLKIISKKTYFFGKVLGKASNVASLIGAFRACSIAAFEQGRTFMEKASPDILNDKFAAISASNLHGCLPAIATQPFSPHSSDRSTQELKNTLKNLMYADKFGGSNPPPKPLMSLAALHCFEEMDAVNAIHPDTTPSVESPDN